MDPFVAMAEMAKVMRMGNEPTAEDRTDAALGGIETYLEIAARKHFPATLMVRTSAGLREL